MKLFYTLLVFSVVLLTPASSQQVGEALVVSSCGTPGRTLTAGSLGPTTVDTTGTLCTASSGGGGGGSVTQGTVPWVVSNAGTFAVQAAESGTWTVQPGNTANTTPWLVTGSGTAGTAAAGVLTVQGIASMTPLLVTPAANSSVNVAQVGGSSIALGSTTGAASIPVVIANNQTAADPCMFQAKTNVAISTASGTTALVTGVSAKKIYVCSLSIIAASAVSVSLSEGSSSTCGTSNQAAVIGVATSGTAANGLSLPANGGLTLGNGGGTVASTATAANYLCLFQSGVIQIAGNLTYVQQ